MRTRVDVASLRGHQFGRLDANGLVYLDYTAAALHPAILVRRDARRLNQTVLGNPHSDNAPSLASDAALETARRLTLRFFNAEPADYDVVFTANASSAIRILAEAFPFRSGSRLVLTADNHNSVNGLRVPARRRGAVTDYIPLDTELRSFDARRWLPRVQVPSLFAFPAQSNFSGVQHPLEWVAAARQRGWFVLLDAAAFVPTSPLSLRDVPADFVALSFYKMFGYPTGVGALIVRREALSALRRRYFGGGTVQFVSVQNRTARLKNDASAFEDGTPNFLALQAVSDGLRWLHDLGMRQVKAHVTRITEDLLQRLASLGERVELYGPRTTNARGGIVTFNVRRNGCLLPYEEVEATARDAGIAIRGGCFCNPGAAEHAFDIPAQRARLCMRGEFSIPRFRACLGQTPVGALRASVGIPTTSEDLDRLYDFLVQTSC